MSASNKSRKTASRGSIMSRGQPLPGSSISSSEASREGKVLAARLYSGSQSHISPGRLSPLPGSGIHGLGLSSVVEPALVPKPRQAMTQSRSLPSLPQNNQNKIETACLEASSKFLGSPWKAKKNTVDTNSKKISRSMIQAVSIAQSPIPFHTFDLSQSKIKSSMPLVPASKLSKKSQSFKSGEKSTSKNVSLALDEEITFLDTLNLDERYLDEFAAGNFLYLRHPPGRYKQPYDLVPCEHFETDQNDYYTLSQAGITHFTASESSFTRLEEWENEFYIYRKIQNIRFFAQYRHWKAFNEWKYNVRRKKMRNAAQQLSSTLFILHPSLCMPLLELSSMCHQVTQWKLLVLDGESTVSLNKFRSDQEMRCRSMSIQLENLFDEARKVIREACDSALDFFLEANQINTEHKITFMERAALQNCCRRLTRFIRLVDFLLVDALQNMAFNSLEDVLVFVSRGKLSSPIVKTRELKETSNKHISFGNSRPNSSDHHDGRSRVSHSRTHTNVEEELTVEETIPALVLVLCVDPNPKDIDFSEYGPPNAFDEPEAITSIIDELDLSILHSPTREEVQTMFAACMTNAVQLISEPRPMLTHPDLSSYTQTTLEEMGEPEELNLGRAVLDSERYSQLMDGVASALRYAFMRVTEFLQIYEPFKNTFVYDERHRACIREVYSPDQNTGKQVSLNIFEDNIRRFMKQISKFKTIPISADIGILRVDSLSLKNIFLPAPDKCLEATKQLLPQLMIANATDLLNEVTEMNRVVSTVPTSVKEFVHVMQYANRVNEGMQSLLLRFERVEHMQEIQHDNNWLISEEHNALLVALQESRTSLDQALHLATERIEVENKRFMTQVDQHVPIFKKQILAIKDKLNDQRLGDPKQDLDEMIAFVSSLEETVTDLVKGIEEHKHHEQMLGMSISEFDGLQDITEELDLKAKLWRGIRDWDLMTAAWNDLPFHEIDTDMINKEVIKYSRVVAAAEHNLPGNNVTPILKDKVEAFKSTLPIVVDLRCKALQPRHWQEIESLIGHHFDPDKVYTLGDLLALKVMNWQQEIASIAQNAVQEKVLEGMLTKIENTWEKAEFIVLPYKDKKDVFVLGSVEEIMVDLDDNLVSINTILGSRYCAPIRERVELWRNRLVLLSETLEEWLQCQRTWRYLENIFAAPDIQRQLASEDTMFRAVDNSWQDVMRRIEFSPRCMLPEIVDKPMLRDLFQKHNDTLDKIQKSLEEYLSTKRDSFPRFYFLSNDELLEILSQARSPQSIQPHLRKCFDNIVALEFGSDPGASDTIMAMLSAEGERVPLSRGVKARGSVEDWMNIVQSQMIDALRKLMKTGLQDYTTNTGGREKWVFDHPGQIVATVAQIMWAMGCERAMTARDPQVALAAWYDVNVKQINKLTALVRTDLSKLQRKIVVALITTDVHARDIVEVLQEEQVYDVSSFEWQKQLRYYWENEDCLIRQSNANFLYGYEYMGATSRLVITPLTDRCWMTITGALHLKLGANPQGPAGTGKTESTKDLAKAMGIFCVVFNCSDQINYKMLGRLFSGLAQGGYWTCLDEFNRIDIEVLSVVAQQLLVLRNALLSDRSTVNFESRIIPIKPHGVHVTMNPGYAGRTELPDNLKVCFRPVSMMIPDYALIAEVMLFAEGFQDAKNLSRKMTKLYNLSSQQLSQQSHYDFGMRAVKSVLVMAGALKRSEPSLDEEIVLIRALRDSNLPKFIAEDLPLFSAILTDLFPGVSIPSRDYGELQTAAVEITVTHGLQPEESFIRKVVQLFETFSVRFGVVLVGPTGGGKTCIYRVLADAMTKLCERGSKNEEMQQVHLQVLNPKSVSMGELYGEVDPMTQEWHDGIAPTLMRPMVEDRSTDRHWVVFDGPIDALWIENMNTVLDDNMTLCLANSERIKLRSEMRMLFEVQDLVQASPATVSRLGVVFVNSDDLGWRCLVKSWMQRTLPIDMSAPIKDHLMGLFERYVDPALELVSNSISPIPSAVSQLVAGLCALLEAMLMHRLQDAKGRLLAPNLNFNETAQRAIERIFVFCLTWSILGGIDADSSERASIVVSDWMERDNVSWPALPGGDTIFDILVSIDDAGNRAWSDLVPPFQYNPNVPYFQLVVPTTDTVRFSYLAETLLRSMRPVFFTGVTGTGKSVIVSDLLRRLQHEPEAEETDTNPEVDLAGDQSHSKQTESEEKAAAIAAILNAGMSGPSFLPIVLNLSARTSSNDTQDNIEGKLEKKRKNLLGGPAGKNVIIFVDDVNMPAVEEYGAQPPIELLRQLVDFGGFYDRKKLFWKAIKDAVMVSASAPPGGGRNELTPRFTRHFTMFCLPQASDIVLRRIFGSILSGFLEPFAKEVHTLSMVAVIATIEVYQRISMELLPTPAKSHYTFNLRDVSKVFQGMLMVKPQQANTPEILARLWSHECMRVFHDRLISLEDRQWFKEMIVELLRRQFKQDITLENLFDGEMPLTFCDFVRPGLDPSVYEEAKDTRRLIKVLDAALDDYNLAHPTRMRLVFFKDAVQHIARVSRVLRQPRGNAMLVGVGGSGKQSLTRMACHLSNVDCFSIEITRGYSINEFREDIKSLMMKTGVDGKEIAFLFTDTQIVVEAFLEDINNLLNTGEVPNLLQQDDVNKIVDAVRPIVRELGMPETRDQIISHFVSRVRDKLHVILCMSPVGDAFRVRCRMFPSLINCCTIDWFDTWPRDALLAVSQWFLSDLDVGETRDAAEQEEENQVKSNQDKKAPVNLKRQASQTAFTEDRAKSIRKDLAVMCVEAHISVEEMSAEFWEKLHRRYYTTPKSYLDLINLYMKMLKEKRAELQVNRQRLKGGITTLQDTNNMVEGLQQELTALQPVLLAKTQETEELVKRVEKDKQDADKVRIQVEDEEREVKSKAEEVRVVQEDAQRDLDVAMPALNDAISALSNLSKKQIQEIRSFPNPPVAVKTTMEAVCTLLDEQPNNWDTAKRVLNDPGFMKRLVDFDKDNIPPAILRKLRRYLEDPVFQISNVAQVSEAATSLCSWCHAMDVYARVFKEIEPKQQKVAELTAVLNEANAQLKSKQDELQAVMDKVWALQDKLDKTIAERNRLVAETRQTEGRLKRAEQLTQGLAGEQVRWTESVASLGESIVNLVGDAFLAAACVSYYGAFTGEFREALIQRWQHALQATTIPVSEKFSLVRTLGDPVQIREWNINGLPTDAVSIDNAILVTRGQRWALMIDPQEQAKKWIKTTEHRSKIEILRLNNPNLRRTLENCIPFGTPVLVEDVNESLDPTLDPILARATYKQGGRLLIRLGDADIDYDPTFRFYITTKMPNPHYLPEVCIKVNIINFTVTMSGLEDQLLGEVVKQERPDVEERKNRLVISMAADKKQLQDIEDKILQMLSEVEGNILDDEELIETLGDSKVISGVITERLEEAEKNEVEINHTRNSYRSVAVRGSMLYFIIANLSQVDPMYQYSLSYFTRLYNHCIEDCPKQSTLEARLSVLQLRITSTMFNNVCRGLFEKHKLTFAFLICVNIMLGRGEIVVSEWNLIVRGAGLLQNPVPNPHPDTISDAQWNFLHAIEECSPSTFRGEMTLCNHIKNHFKTMWRNWFESKEPQSVPLPEPWCDSLTAFQRMLIIKALREEKLLFAISDFVEANLGPEFVSPPTTTMTQVYLETSSSTPIVFILSPGTNPFEQLLQFAKQKDYGERLQSIALGQGQGPAALQTIRQSVKSGDWVLLQNCHLGKSWLPTLEKIVEFLANPSMAAVTNPGGKQDTRGSSEVPMAGITAVHEDFRLFLTSMPASYFPIPILQNGVKLTTEPPKGVRANLLRSYDMVSTWVDFESCSKPAVWKKLVFGLSFFHAVVQERRNKFGPLGFNNVYEFNDTDLETSIRVLRNFLDEQDSIPWDALLYVCGHINYGGRVTDDWDRRCLVSLMNKFFAEPVLSAEYTFSQSGTYFAPAEGELDSYIQYIQTLPLNDDPEVFGMHENANIAFQQQETDKIIYTCLSMGPAEGASHGSGGKSDDVIVSEVVKEISEKLPQNFDRLEAGADTLKDKEGFLDSLNVVLIQEMARYNKLLNTMRSTLEGLRRAICGEVVMSQELDKMFKAILINGVPEIWEKAAYPSLKPLASWVDDLLKRVHFFRTWLIEDKPISFWLSGFIFPQGFITGALQNHSRKYQVAIDALQYSFRVLNKSVDELDLLDKPSDGILIHGLYLEGARWDTRTERLEESMPGEMNAEMPVIHFLPAINYKSPKGTYTCPVYKIGTRAGALTTTGLSSNFIIGVDLATNQIPSKWTLMGVALLTMLGT